MDQTSHETELIFQACLNLVLSGEETVESVLARHPGLTASHREELEAAAWLNSRARSLDPRPGFVAASRRRLVARIQQDAPQPSMAWWRIWLDQLRSPRLAVQLSIISALVLMFIFSANLAAWASREALPVDAVYPVKLAVEQYRLLVSLTPEGDAALHIEFAGRRAIEIQAMALAGDFDQIENLTKQFENHVGKATNMLSILSNEKSPRTVELANSLESTLASQTIVLDLLTSVVPDDAKPSIEQALTISEQGIEAAQEILSHTGGQQQPTSTATIALAMTATPSPTASLVPIGTRPASPTATSVLLPGASPTIQPTEAEPEATPTAEPTNTPKPSNTPKPTNTARPSNTHKPPTNTPKPPNTHKPPTNTPKPPKPTDPPEPTDEPKPSKTPKALSGPLFWHQQRR